MMIMGIIQAEMGWLENISHAKRDFLSPVKIIISLGTNNKKNRRQEQQIKGHEKIKSKDFFLVHISTSKLIAAIDANGTKNFKNTLITKSQA